MIISYLLYFFIFSKYKQKISCFLNYRLHYHMGKLVLLLSHHWSAKIFCNLIFFKWQYHIHHVFLKPKNWSSFTSFSLFLKLPNWWLGLSIQSFSSPVISHSWKDLLHMYYCLSCSVHVYLMLMSLYGCSFWHY